MQLQEIPTESPFISTPVLSAWGLTISPIDSLLNSSITALLSFFLRWLWHTSPRSLKSSASLTDAVNKIHLQLDLAAKIFLATSNFLGCDITKDFLALKYFINWVQHPLTTPSDFPLLFAQALALDGDLINPIINLKSWLKKEKSLWNFALYSVYCVMSTSIRTLYLRYDDTQLFFKASSRVIVSQTGQNFSICFSAWSSRSQVAVSPSIYL